MKRQVVLDTETTGLEAAAGHRIIEVAAIALLNRKKADTFHSFVNPQRSVGKGAKAVHRISDAQLKDKPLFSEICDSLLDFVRGSQLIIHNAGFDLGFLDAEFKRAGRGSFIKESGCEIVDTMELAAELNPGLRRSLDALCDQYGVDRAARETGHSAVLDAELLAAVYLAMTGGQMSMDLKQEIEMVGGLDESRLKGDAKVLSASAEELQLHESFMQLIKEKTKAQKLPAF